MLNQFQAVWDSDMADCESMVRRRRRIMASLAIEDEEVLDLLERDGSWTDVLDETDANFEDHRANLHRKVQDDENVWDLWHEDVSWQISLFLKAVGADWSRQNAFEVNVLISHFLHFISAYHLYTIDCHIELFRWIRGKSHRTTLYRIHFVASY